MYFISNPQDIGGGLGIDYDGSKTSFEASINYTVEELRTFACLRVVFLNPLLRCTHSPPPLCIHSS
jgi:arginine decarboxylase